MGMGAWAHLGINKESSLWSREERKRLADSADPVARSGRFVVPGHEVVDEADRPVRGEAF